jgi:hypothetical protein
LSFRIRREIASGSRRNWRCLDFDDPVYSATKGGNTMSENGYDLVARVHREFIERNPSPPFPERPTIHYTELPPSRPGDTFAEEWETYRREVGRLLAEGNEGRYILIKGTEIIGIWDRQQDALSMGYQKYLLQPFLVHQIQERERLLYMVCHPV